VAGLCLPLRHVGVTDVEVAIGEQVLKIQRLGPFVLPARVPPSIASGTREKVSSAAE